MKSTKRVAALGENKRLNVPFFFYPRYPIPNKQAFKISYCP
jgi:hypothetical protein